MAAEKLTPWNAPKPSELEARKKQKAKIDAEFKEAMKLLGMDEFGNPLPKKPEKPLKWWQFIKKWNRKYKDKTFMETPLVYVWYLLLIAPQIPGMVQGKPIPAGAVGFIAGIMLMTFIHRLAMDQKEKWHKMELEMQEHDIKFKMGLQQYAAKRPNQPAQRPRVR